MDTTTRLGLHHPTGGDPADVPSDVGRLADQLDSQMAVYDVGPIASRPAAGTAGRLYYATDVGAAFLDDGSTWQTLAWSPGDTRFTAASGAPPVGWLACDGSAVSRTRFAALFSAIGTTYGAGDGSTTFNLPDLRGRVPVGAGQGPSLTARTLGQQTGAEEHTLATAQMPSHSHGVIDPGHNHGIRLNSAPSPLTGVQFIAGNGQFIEGNDVVTQHTTGISIASNGLGQPHNNMQPSLVLVPLIKT